MKRNALALMPLRTAKPAALRKIYAQPAKDLLMQTRRGTTVKLARGIYMAKPDTIRVEEKWFPTNELAGAAVATALYGNRVPVLMGVTAARMHHAIPRALNTIVVAVPRQHDIIHLANGALLRFVERKRENFEALPMQTEFGAVMVTTPEQTLLDLLRRPELGDVPYEAHAAARMLLRKVDPKKLTELAEEQGGRAKDRLAAFLDKEHD